jgi:hypothetical protein
LRWQARRRSPNRLGNRHSAGERPMPHAVGSLAALDRLRSTELGQNRPDRDSGVPRPAGARSPADTRFPAGARSPAGARFPAGARSPADSRSPTGARSPADSRSRATAAWAADGRSPRFGLPGCRSADSRCPGFRFPAMVRWPAIGQPPAAAACPAAGLAPDFPRQARARRSMAPAPRPRAMARTRSVPGLAARLPDRPRAEPGGHPRESPARPRPRTRPGGLGSSSRAWFASCLPWQLRREHSTGPCVTIAVTRALTCVDSALGQRGATAKGARHATPCGRSASAGQTFS